MDDEITLYIILRKSLHLNNSQEAYCVADAVQHILMKYFMLQILSIKTNLPLENNHLTITTKWLSSHTKKNIISVNEDIWEKLKNEFNTGKDLFYLKNDSLPDPNAEAALVMWPLPSSSVPNYLK